jgi:hypothetical protein
MSAGDFKVIGINDEGTYVKNEREVSINID